MVKNLAVKQEIYRNPGSEKGDYCLLPPPVCSAYWSELDWIRYIDKEGFWKYPKSFMGEV